MHNGFSVESLKIAWLTFPFTFVAAFLCEWFLVGKLAMKLAHKFLKEDDLLLKKILITALCFVTGMVVLMSFFGPLLANGPSSDLIRIWIKGIPMNFAMAFPLQVLIAGPLVGFVFRKYFPIGTIVVPVKED
ncbi:DUF2798 domain-containing protein [Flavobacterium sp. ZS1P14]|uniref:DUF2798 domain-containing protein n=1 Tax=Flavobacterium sp. ZS1P14 TaxID=3401729 RepID=UPI003AB0BA83